MIDKQKLREIASKATPGRLRQGAVDKHHVFIECHDDESLGHERVLLAMNTWFPYEDDAAFIAEASRDAVIALLDENDANRSWRTWAERELDQLATQNERLRKLAREACEIAKQADWYAMPSGCEVAEVHEETIAAIEKELNDE